MNINYIRIIFLVVLTTCLIYILPFSKDYSKKDLSSFQESDIKFSIEDKGKKFFDSLEKIDNFGHTYVNSKLFKNIKISHLNGSILNLDLADYKKNLEESKSISILNQDKDNLYLAKILLSIENGESDIVFKYVNTLRDENSVTISFSGKTNSIDVLRTYIFDDSYFIKIIDRITNIGKSDLEIGFSNIIFRQIKNNKSKLNLFDSRSYSFNGIAFSSDKKLFKKLPFSKISKHENIKDNNSISSKGWIGIVENYFTSIWFSPTSLKGNLSIYYNMISGDLYEIGLKIKNLSVPKSQTILNEKFLYIGPKIVSELSPIISTKHETNSLNRIVDYGKLSFIASLIFELMNKVNVYTGNWGLSIILVTILIKIFFFPLSHKSYKAMAHIKLLNPRIKSIQEIYKDDRKALGVKMGEIYKKEKVNPASGCFPMMIQIPFFISLYWVLNESVCLRHAPFYLWILDLSDKDPYYVLPILMGLSMFIQQRFNTSTLDSSQARVAMLMPFIFVFLFCTLPSGLMLYWLTNNILNILHQAYVSKKVDVLKKSFKE